MTATPTEATEKKEEPKDQQIEKTGQLGALEEDDEFEEFEAEEWEENNEDQVNDSLCEDNWDDDDVEEDFSKVLEAESVKSHSDPQPMNM